MALLAVSPGAGTVVATGSVLTELIVVTLIQLLQTFVHIFTAVAISSYPEARPTVRDAVIGSQQVHTALPLLAEVGISHTLIHISTVPVVPGQGEASRAGAGETARSIAAGVRAGAGAAGALVLVHAKCSLGGQLKALGTANLIFFSLQGCGELEAQGLRLRVKG